MIRNYFRIAIKSLRRNTFFTTVSLFGIAFTLMLLVLVASLFESNLGDSQPLTHKDLMVICNRGNLRNIDYDTLFSFDTMWVSGEMQVDTQIQYMEHSRGGWQDNLGYYLLDKYYRDITSAKTYSFIQDRIQRDVFVNDRKLTFSSNHSDAAYWDIFDFDFVEGRPFGKQDVEFGANVCVITTRASRSIFGSETGTVGKEFSTNGRQCKVVGIVKPVTTFVPFINNDLFFPLTHLSPSALRSHDYLGPFTAVYLAARPRDRQQVIDEIKHITNQVPMPTQGNYSKLVMVVADFNASIANRLAPFASENGDLAWIILKTVIGVLVLIFIAVPTINLINLNVSRTLERSSEIGVRKAFGASTGAIIRQLLFENIVLTMLGGIFGFMAALLAIWLINQYTTLIILKFNGVVFIYGLLLALVFGLISGILPAYRSSQMHVVDALKNSKL